MSRRRLDITDEMVIDLYFNKDLSCNKTAKILKCDRNLIKGRIKKLGLELKNKTMSKHVYDGMKTNVPMSNDFLNILDGEMLGDGYIHVSRENCMGYFSEGVGYNKKEWLEHIYKLFKYNNIPIGKRNVYERKDKPGWVFCTKGTEELGNVQRRWYVKNKKFDDAKPAFFGNRIYIKMVPTDLKLTSNCLLHWYVGDGKYTNNGSIYLCTNGFSWAEVEFLRLLLKKSFSLITSHSKENMISIPRYEATRMLEIIGSCPVKCYEYKWNVNYSRKTKIQNHIDMKMVEDYIHYRNSL